MFALVFLVLTIVLFSAFLFFARYEASRGQRFFADARGRLDASVLRTEFLLTHVDFESFLRDVIRTLAARITHDVAHLTLLLVRSVERLLTRLVRHLRTEHDINVSSETQRPFVKAMSDFKQQLASTRPTLQEIQP